MSLMTKPFSIQNDNATDDACNQDPCRAALVAYQQATDALDDAANAVQRLEDALSQQGRTALGGVIAIGAGAALSGPVPFVGGLLIGGGIGALVVAGVRALQTTRQLGRARPACADARTLAKNAKDAVLESCPSRCWPSPFTIRPCP